MPVSSSFIQKPQGKSHLPLGTSGVDETLRVPGHTVEPPGQVGFRLPGAKSQGRFNRDLTWHLVAICGKRQRDFWEIGGNCLGNWWKYVEITDAFGVSQRTHETSSMQNKAGRTLARRQTCR